MADASRLFAPIARAAFPGPARAALVRRRDDPPSGERRAAAPRARSSTASNRIDEMVVFPVHPRTRARMRGGGPRARPARAPHRASQLPRARLARLAGARDRDGLGRSAEGGVLVRRAVRHRAGRRPSGSTPCASRRERPRRRRLPTAIAEAVANASMPPNRPVLYGDGHASERIAQVLAATIPSR